MIQITSNIGQWVEQANDTASVFRRKDVQRDLQRELARHVRRMNKAQILGGGIGKSGKFQQLKPATIKRKKLAKNILVDTGSLFRKATRGGTVKAGYIPSFRVFTFTFTIKHPAINFLQKGTKFMPARPVIDPTKEQTDDMSRALRDGIFKAWRKIGWFDKLDPGRFTGFDKIEVDR